MQFLFRVQGSPKLPVEALNPMVYILSYWFCGGHLLYLDFSGKPMPVILVFAFQILAKRFPNASRFQLCSNMSVHRVGCRVHRLGRTAYKLNWELEDARGCGVPRRSQRKRNYFRLFVGRLEFREHDSLSPPTPPPPPSPALQRVKLGVIANLGEGERTHGSLVDWSHACFCPAGRALGFPESHMHVVCPPGVPWASRKVSGGLLSRLGGVQ